MAILQVLNDNEALHADLAIKFIDACIKGMVKPYDPEAYHKKLEQMEANGIDTSYLRKCCPPVGEIREGKELKPYIMAAANRVADILNLPVQKYKYEERS